MTGETNLKTLLAGLSPVLSPGTFVFATLPPGDPVPAMLDPVMIFREQEGTTLILAEHEAREADIAATFRCRMITLDIHSSLEGVGFLAAVAARLAQAGIGVNPVAGFFHDHLFVPPDRADEAMAVLGQLEAEHRD